MWETVAGLVVEAEAPKITMPEDVEFVGNWEVDEVERRVAEMPTLSFGSEPAFNSTGDLGMNSTQAFARKMQKMEHHQHRQRVACVTTAILVVAVFFPGHSRQLTRQGFWQTGE